MDVSILIHSGVTLSKVFCHPRGLQCLPYLPTWFAQKRWGIHFFSHPRGLQCLCLSMPDMLQSMAPSSANTSLYPSIFQPLSLSIRQILKPFHFPLKLQLNPSPFAFYHPITQHGQYPYPQTSSILPHIHAQNSRESSIYGPAYVSIISTQFQ